MPIPDAFPDADVGAYSSIEITQKKEFVIRRYSSKDSRQTVIKVVLDGVIVLHRGSIYSNSREGLSTGEGYANHRDTLADVSW